MLDGVAGLVLGDRLVSGEGEALVAVLREPAGVRLLAIVGIGYMAACAAARPIVTGHVVRCHQPQTRIVEPRLLNCDVYAGDLGFGTSVAVAGCDVAAFENSERISRLGDLEAGHGEERLEHSV